MIKKILFLLFVLISINTFAQINVKENTFHKIDGYMMFDKEDHRDDNWKPMALIKITAEGMKAEERARLVFHGNMGTYIDVKQMDTETYLYLTAKAATFIEIKHPDYGKTEYWFSEDLCDFCGYEMVIEYVPKVVESTYGFLAISSEPSDAEIYIDGKHYGKTNNVITDLIAGSHVLKLEKEGFNIFTKNINITKGETLKLNETLQAIVNKKTYLIVKADQADARIYIDDELLNTQEASKTVNVGSTHTYRIECNLYYEESGSVTIQDRTVVDKKLRPAFGYINISTTPEQGAKAFVDGNYVGLTPIKTDKIKSGTHKVMVMKDMYKMKELSFVVTDGQTTNATLNMSANFVNITVKTDSQSDIYVDEEFKGKGSWTGRLSDGTHIFEARKNNHRTSKKNVDLVLGETKTITVDAPSPIKSEVDINTSPMGATICIDGKSYGETPNYLSDILIGEHELKLTKPGYADLKKNIVIREGETLTINEKLQVKSQQITDNGQQSLVVNGANQTITVRGVTFTMVKVEGGTFYMGATIEQGNEAYDDERPVHSVTLSDYYIGETEVTQELWQAVMGSNPSLFSGNTQRPVENVMWSDCQDFITKLNELTGMNFRLPTEAEWEYAARGGDKNKGCKYSGSHTIGNVAWYTDNSSFQTHDVKTKAANELGIYDMNGNVLEWCQDWYGDYSKASQTNPTGPTSGTSRVCRGGGMGSDAKVCRVSTRFYGNLDYKGSILGLRLSLSQ